MTGYGRQLVTVFLAMIVSGAACSSPASQTTNTRALVNQTEPTESGCAQEGSIQSPASFEEATITFENQTAGAVKVYWVDFDGARQLYESVAAGKTLEQETWLGHVWVVTDSADQCLALHSANALEQTLVID